ncbi:MAG: methyltransferase domain-containing protein [Bacteroidetes bacterium]|nr:methyltransferase domain-containing protein [Bacteroidota bacterium]MBS1972954.1 methyltransferase domain-containing protein [Bacteroidota bacterium]
MKLKNRSDKKELLDSEGIPFDAIKQNMHELDIINSLLGGHRVTLSGFKKTAGTAKQLVVCEIGCGGGDNLFFLKKWCEKKGISAIFIGVDINNNCIEYAKSKMHGNEFHFVVGNYKACQFAEKPDIVFSSLFCHHFSDVELVGMLQWMEKNSSIGFFVNDLHRNIIAYYSIKWLTKFFSRSYLVRNDAPLSVLRGFKKTEWARTLKQAGINNYCLQWKWAFRWLIVSTNKNK